MEFKVCEECLLHEMKSIFQAGCQRCMLGEGYCIYEVCHCKSMIPKGNVKEWFKSKSIIFKIKNYGIRFLDTYGLY